MLISTEVLKFKSIVKINGISLVLKIMFLSLMRIEQIE